MRNRTVLVNSMSKTFSVTGWRVGWVLGHRSHRHRPQGARFPDRRRPRALAEAGAIALNMPASYYGRLAARNRPGAISCLQARASRVQLLPVLKGAYYIMMRYLAIRDRPDMCHRQAHDRKSESRRCLVPASLRCSCRTFNLGALCFCKKMETLEEAACAS